MKGEDVNLCSLLISAYIIKTPTKEQEKEDKRLNRTLNFSEFVTAFSWFKRIMCANYPWRQQELDMYLANIIQCVANKVL